MGLYSLFTRKPPKYALPLVDITSVCIPTVPGVVSPVGRLLSPACCVPLSHRQVGCVRDDAPGTVTAKVATPSSESPSASTLILESLHNSNARPVPSETVGVLTSVVRRAVSRTRPRERFRRSHGLCQDRNAHYQGEYHGFVTGKRSTRTVF